MENSLFIQAYEAAARSNLSLIATPIPEYGIGATAIGPGKYGNLIYNQICLNQRQSYWVIEQQVPYAVKNDQWIGYDDIQSKLKLDVSKPINWVVQ